MRPARRSVAATPLTHVKAVGIYPVGTLVRLQSGRLAVVSAQDDASLLHPTVMVFFATKTKLLMPPHEVHLAAPRCQDRIVGCEAAAAWGFTDLDRLWGAPQLAA